MRKISIVGNFADGTDSFNGQTIKTRIVARQLESLYGMDEVCRVDTAGGMKVVARLVWQLWKCVRGSRNVVVLPAQNGIKVILPLVVMYNCLFHRTIHYVVIGGWLMQLLRQNRWLLPFARKVDMIYPETKGMKDGLHNIGIDNVTVMPNCKPLHILSVDELEVPRGQQPMRLCVFSRVTRTKGVEDAVKAVRMVNERAGATIATLDIYGKVDDGPWFDSLKTSFGDAVKYCGCVAFDKSVDTLRAYTALLFPTFYPGEGLAGTIIDAFAAGLPVIASDWHDNANIVADGKTGYIFPVHDTRRIADIILGINDNRDVLLAMKRNCVEAAAEYLPGRVVNILTDHLK